MGRVLVLVAAIGIAGCMEVEQANSGRQSGQTVKRDTPAWNSEPLANGPQWTKGDRSSWERQIRQRQLSQNETQRIESRRVSQ